jgi:hypothetical protein
MAKGTKNRSDPLLSQFVKQIAEEVATGETETNAERLARVLWHAALGYTEDLGEGKKKTWPPAKWAIDLVYERAEGKAAQVGDSGDKKGDISDRIGQKTIDRLNKLAEITRAGSPKPTPSSKPAPPKRLVSPNPRSVGRSDLGAQGPQTGPRASSLMEKGSS